ncbi:MAG: hypothetical protein OK422_03595 [Thaumarchaeota archaeon]|nr:hypothetical protein [Nitrososphaerota archaeon]
MVRVPLLGVEVLLRYVLVRGTVDLPKVTTDVEGVAVSGDVGSGCEVWNRAGAGDGSGSICAGDGADNSATVSVNV